MLDSKCFYHVTSHRYWFIAYQYTEGDKVFMENSAACKVVEIGRIQIKMHDGVVRTLTYVRHIPKLRKNLISLSACDGFT